MTARTGCRDLLLPSFRRTLLATMRWRRRDPPLIRGTDVFSVAAPEPTDTPLEEVMASLAPGWRVTPIPERNAMEIQRSRYTLTAEDDHAKLELRPNKLILRLEDIGQLQADLGRAASWLRKEAGGS